MPSVLDAPVRKNPAKTWSSCGCRAVPPNASTTNLMRMQRGVSHQPALLTSPVKRHPARRRRVACAAGIPPMLAHAAAYNLAGLLIGGGLLLLGLAACVLCITAIPTIRVTACGLAAYDAQHSASAWGT